MIKNKNDYIEYVKADRMALNNPNWKSIVWRYLKTMRKAEFYTNCRGGWIAKLYRFKLKLLSEKSGICIPINTFGKGLGLFHYGTIIVNATAKFGDYCVIQTCTVISKNVSGGDYVYIAPGVKINDNIQIGNNIILGQNAVVTKNITEDGTTWDGIPAKKISNKGFYDDDKYQHKK